MSNVSVVSPRSVLLADGNKIKMPTLLGTPGQVMVLSSDGTEFEFTASGASWGSIAGTLADQSDLQFNLDSKQDADDDLTALAAVSGTDTIYYRSGISTWSAVTIGAGLTFNSGNLDTAGGGNASTVTISDLSGEDTTWLVLANEQTGDQSPGTVTALTWDDYVGSLNIPGSVTLTGTLDGRDVAADGAKLDTIETGADVTNTASVSAAGGVLYSEIDFNITSLSLPANTTISAFAATFLDDADAASVRTTLVVDPAGTDNSVILITGTPDYITYSTGISGEHVFNLEQVDLATDVTGNLSASNINGGLNASSTTFLRGDMTWETPVGGGNVSNTGTPMLGELAVWTSATVIEGTTALMFGSGLLSVTGSILVTGTVDGRDVAVDGIKLDTIETGADVTDAANVNAAGATMNADADVSGNSWVLDEDDLTSDDNTKVPTQQSVKAYVDANAGSRKSQITFNVGGTITTGVKKYLSIPFACTITKAIVLLDVSGSVVVDIWKDTYANYPPTNADSITGAAPPTVSGALKSEDATLTGWTTAITAGDILAFNVDSIATATQVTVILEITID